MSNNDNIVSAGRYGRDSFAEARSLYKLALMILPEARLRIVLASVTNASHAFKLVAKFEKLTPIRAIRIFGNEQNQKSIERICSCEMRAAANQQH
ncbi:MAG TPA: hypothetical protein VED01_09260 [Burkholderiales bacterium]|nr:hypothetical protein [Burkholderiales bacterium]